MYFYSNGPVYDIISADYQGRNITLYDKAGIEKYYIVFNTDCILARCVGFLGDDSKILLSMYTSYYKSMKTYSYILDLNKPNEQYLIYLNNKHEPYKCVFDSLTHEIYYDIRKSNEFEHREINTTNDFRFIKCTDNLFDIIKVNQ